MFERFTDDARSVVVGAQRHAVALHHGYIGTEHLLLGLLDEGSERGTRVLRDFGIRPEWVRGEVERIVGVGEPDLDADALATLGIDLDTVRERVERTFGAGALAPRRGRRRRGVLGQGCVPFTARAKKVLELSLREAVHLGDSSIASEHVLLALTREGDGIAGRILRSKGLDEAAVRAALERDAAR